MSPLQIRVIVIDDDREIASLISENLTELGLCTFQALSGEAALAMLANPDHKFDLIVLDLGLGDISGWNILERIHSRESRYFLTPVLVISGYSHEDSRARIAGAAEFLPKPFTYQRLIAAVGRLLDLEFG